MPTQQNSYPNEYWAFQLGRLVAKLPVCIAEAYLSDGYLLTQLADSSPPEHIEDKYPNLYICLSDLQETIEQLKGRGPITLKNIACKALSKLDNFKLFIWAALEGESPFVVAEHFSNLQDYCRSDSGGIDDDTPILEFLARFFYEEESLDFKPAKRGRPKKSLPDSNESIFPLSTAEWKALTKQIDDLGKKLANSYVFFQTARALQEASDSWVVKARPVHNRKSRIEFKRELDSLVQCNITSLEQQGIEVGELSLETDPDRTSDIRLKVSLDQISEQLTKYEREPTTVGLTITEFRNMENLQWKEVTIIFEEPEACNPYIKIEARGFTVRNLASKMGFTSAKNRPLTVLATLAKFCEKEGFITFPPASVVHPELRKKEQSSASFGSSREDELEKITPPRLKNPVEPHQVSNLRKHLKSLLSISDDPLYPYHSPSGHTTDKRQGSGGPRTERLPKGYRLKCTCRVLRKDS